MAIDLRIGRSCINTSGAALGAVVLGYALCNPRPGRAMLDSMVQVKLVFWPPNATAGCVKGVVVSVNGRMHGE